ncbi:MULTISPECIES: sugar phosphate isomerase/epimerase family protein [Rhodococcus]|nr:MULTISPECIES: TIM barrel protein [Rhodococcus]MDV7243555.1 TIM barrel protein [Rhodococcus oxybenzonivorans]MDV7277531.1 TIM barrel protein [Rhodococcus oxybenzonivorans]MDV7335441.1 TIM barrel protein [Rhodococcus oxybenzonivorans]MDV7347243.1 TIM barrel protein [Rhodococcus oxybenzonivorans]MDV8028698.1 TIM barrel protein [Rhodococcus sp. IEGM 27]
MTAPLGLAALTVLDTAPLQQVDLAEKHGFDTIGIRLLPAAPGTTAYPLHEDDAALDALIRRLDDSPIEVFDLEIVRLGVDFDPKSYVPLLEAGARLGAKAVLVGGDDRDRARLTDSYARLAELCGQYGIVASLEFMPWTAVPDATTAVEIVSQADGPARSVLIDALHAARSTTTLGDLAAIPREWLHYAQMCDGSVPAPTNDAELVRHAREERLVPGTGGINLTDIWSTLPPDLPVSVELPNEPLRRAVGTDAWLDRLVTQTRRVLDTNRTTPAH